MDTIETEVAITATMIAASPTCRGECCPLARAILRVVRPGVYVCVLASTIAIIGEEHIDLPGEATAFVRDFDAGRRVSPLTLTLSIPARYLRDAA